MSVSGTCRSQKFRYHSLIRITDYDTVTGSGAAVFSLTLTEVPWPGEEVIFNP